MINKIEMNIPNYKVFINNGKCTINDIEKSITQEDIDSILRTIRFWDNKYIGNGIKEEDYTILLYEDDEIVGEYLFDRKFPDDFYLLLEIIGGIYARG